MCELKKVRIKTIRRSDEPFSRHFIKGYIPKRDFFENKNFNSCAIIASSGGLKNSYLGGYIGNF